MRVKVKDFNCIKEAEFQFNPGLTILQGESNGGKSSVFRAIENTIFNQSGTSNVQHGKQFYLVGIENNGHKVVFKKGKSGGVYKVDGVEYSKVGVGQLEQVADALGIRETVLAGEKVRLNFWSQMGYPFLLDRSPGQLYKFIVDSSESESLSSVLKDIARDIKDTNAEIVASDSKLDLLTSQLSAVEEKLRGAEQVEETCKEIIALDPEFNLLNTLETEVQRYNNLNREILDLNKALISVSTLDISSLEAVYQEYQVVPVIHEYQAKYQAILDDSAKLVNINNSLELLKSIDTIDISELGNLDSLIKDFRDLISSIEKMREQLVSIEESIAGCQEQLSEFEVCPLCGRELSEHES